MSQAWQVRPSELLDVEDRLAAYQLDEAVLLFASSVQGDLDEAEAAAVRRNKPAGPAVKRALEKALGLERPTAAQRGRRYEYDLTGAEPRVRMVKGGKA